MARLIARLGLAMLACCWAGAAPANNQAVPSAPGIDAPELAKLGGEKVGYRLLSFVNAAQPDLLAAALASGPVRLRDRSLLVDLWYPAMNRKGAHTATYHARFWGEPPYPAVSFSVPGLAIQGALPHGKRHPLVIVSHGYSNAPAAMTWLTENLASKGYVVAAIRHEDPNPYVVSTGARAVPNYFRPVDIAFVARGLISRLGDQIDPANIALIGYSQGGYGVLTAGGASLDPEGPNIGLVPGGWMKRLARGGADEAKIRVPGVRAIIALAPGGGSPRNAWGTQGLAAITAPMLLIAGDADHVVDYRQGAATVFENAVHSDRYLLTYHQAGHAIGLSPAPPEMRGAVWDLDWFEDPVWRQDRINAINLHFMTAFLDRTLMGRTDKAAYLDVSVANSADGIWNAPAGTPWGAYSPGGSGVTLWKGFQRRHAEGMTLQRRAASPKP